MSKFIVDSSRLEPEFIEELREEKTPELSASDLELLNKALICCGEDYKIDAQHSKEFGEEETFEMLNRQVEEVKTLLKKLEALSK